MKGNLLRRIPLPQPPALLGAWRPCPGHRDTLVLYKARGNSARCECLQHRASCGRTVNITDINCVVISENQSEVGSFTNELPN